jgi:hypothetical protein
LATAAPLLADHPHASVRARLAPVDLRVRLFTSGRPGGYPAPELAPVMQAWARTMAAAGAAGGAFFGGLETFRDARTKGP